MSLQRTLSTEEDEQWQEFSQHIEWASRFSLMMLFVEDVFLAEQFKQRLQNQLQQQLHIFKPNQASTLTLDIFNELRTLSVPFWLELHQFRSEEWQKALDNFFARFNERRDIIRRDFPLPFIILLPFSYRSRVREIAPDLWSVRSHTDELRANARTANPLVTESPEINKFEHPLSMAEIENSAEIKEWQRVKDLAISDNELFLVTNNAFYPALFSGQWELAETLAQQLLTLSQRMIKTEGENPDSLRNLYLALNSLGSIEGEVGHYETALTTHSESLQVARNLKQKQGDTPQALRDLSVSLIQVADCETNLGHYEAALAGCTESLQIARELKQKLGDTPQALRDLSVSLNKVGDCETNLGRYEAALANYTESLQICRELKQKLGDTPQALRDLSASLEKVADADKALGRYESALKGYKESFQINLGSQVRLGDTPQVLSDLTDSLERIADCENNLEHPKQALAFYQECLPILERLQASQSFDNGYSERISDIQTKIANLQNA